MIRVIKWSISLQELSIRFKLRLIKKETKLLLKPLLDIRNLNNIRLKPNLSIGQLGGKRSKIGNLRVSISLIFSVSINILGRLVTPRLILLLKREPTND